MRKTLLPILFCMLSVTVLSQNTGSISGKVTAKHSNEPLAGATVSVKGIFNSVTSNNEGYFSFKKINAGPIKFQISYVGYEMIELTVQVTDGIETTVNAVLTLDNKTGNEIVVSASKRPEKITNAPACILVIGVKELQQFAGSNVGELVSKLQGVEYTRSGVDEINFNARGLNSAFNNKILQLVDGRNSMSPLSGGLPVFNNGSTSKEDIESVEIVLGPQSALYGPNAHNALFNFISKDPRKYQGTTVALSAGSQNQFSGRFRHAEKINTKWAYKLSGEHASGKDFKWYDSVYAGNQNPPGTTPYYGPAVAIAERNVNFDFRRYRGEAHVYYSVTPKADIIISTGGSNVNRLQVTTSGRNQVRGVVYSFLQARFVHPRFFANIYNTWGSLGTSYIIPNYTRDYWNRTQSSITDPNHPLYKTAGRLSPDSAETNAMRNLFKEKSQRLNAEAQYNYTFQKAGLSLVTGFNYQLERPNGFGSTLIDSFQRINITQYGAVVQLEKKLPWSMRLISTTRIDHHSNFGNFFAPRFALTKKMGDGTARITWGKAYAMPSIQNQYAGIGRSLFGNGGNGIYYIPTGVNKKDTALFKYTIPLQPEQVNTWEIGYKGTIAKKLFIDINYYNGLSKNFISPTISVAGRVLSVNGIKVTHSLPTAGAFVNDTLRNASFSTFFNYGTVRSYGLDAGLNYTFNKFIFLAVKYSWFKSDITDDNIKNDANKDGYVSLEEKSQNTPNHRGMIMLGFQNLCKEKLFITMSARFVEQYDFYSASQIGTSRGEGSRGIIERPRLSPIRKNFDHGPLGGFTTIDLSTGYKLNKLVSVNMGITNLFNTEQIEFVGSPSIGRLIMFELKVQVPKGDKKRN